MSRKFLVFAAVLLVAAAGRAPHALARGVVINELHYEPEDKTVPAEFIELYNRGSARVDLSGWFFSEGVSFTFPAGTILEPKAYLLIAEDPDVLREVFALAEDVRVLGPYEGRLSNDGERLVLRNRAGAIEDRVDYGTRFPWPLASTGRGSSMELINPSLDNDLGGSWRASGFMTSLPAEREYFLRAEAEGWLYRKGTSEASDPIDAWRQPDFEPDDSWLTGQTSIGFNDDDDNTVLDDMRENYTTIYLRRDLVLDAEPPRLLMLGLYADDGAIVWVNGIEVLNRRGPDGPPTFDATAGRSSEARWETFLLDNPGSFLSRGRNVIAVQVFNTSLRSNDVSIDVELFRPSSSDVGNEGAPPTPGWLNSAFLENAPPLVRQVDHQPAQPTSEEAIVVTTKVTDANGVASVTLRYQVVPSGEFLPAYLPLPHPQLLGVRPDQPRLPNPEFEAAESWEATPMRDDGEGDDLLAGDGVFTATLPPQPNRTLVRYRVAASDRAGVSVLVPHRDDRSLNFALFVYDGLPSYRTTRLTVHPDGVGHEYPPDVLETLPIYFLITREPDLTHCIAYNASFHIPKSNERARDRFNWEGAFVYDGRVYDHVFYRLRQANDRYGGQGKRSMRIRFHKGNYLRARDQYGKLYPERWRTLNTGKMFDNKRVGNFGLTETMNADLWNLVGVPAPWFHTFHLRVIDGPEEAPDDALGQYNGDFWGMFNAIEDYDPRFLDAHDMEDGNLYKLKDGIFDGNQLRRNQGRFATKTDADFQNIRRTLRPQRPEEWLDAHVNYEKWYPYHAVVEGIRHYDFRPADSHSKNRAWYFEPDYSGSQFGRLWTLPWDSDASWGPNWNSGVDYTKDAIFTGRKQRFKQAYRNFIREFRDLVWTEEVIHTMIDDLAAFVIDFSMADRDRWRNGPAQTGRQDFGPIQAKIVDMKRFAFIGWTGGSGPTVPAGGRARHLDTLAAAEGDASRVPETPVVTSTSPDDFPRDQLTFTCSEFVDPQGDGFGAMKWRVGQVGDPDRPFDPRIRRPFEWNAVWESGELEEFAPDVHVPANAVEIGRRYRVRVRLRDDTDRWSHWSEPVEFVVGEPTAPSALELGLRVTEIMYNPLGDDAHEFIELRNVHSAPLDLGEVSFTDGIEFAFGGSDVTTLDPGEFVVLVQNRRVFETRYGRRDIPIAGEYAGRLSNGGEWLRLIDGRSMVIQEFRYDDEWYPRTDGSGRSLVIQDELAPRESWSMAVSWRASRVIHGSPGAEDAEFASSGTLQLPGNLDQDDRLAVGDAVTLLRHLFVDASTPLPCGDGTLDDESNRALADNDGDGTVQLGDAVHLLLHLFRGGPPPTLGRSCVPMVGCPDACR